MRKVSWLLLSLFGVIACSGGVGGSSLVSSIIYPQNPENILPNGYQCLPSGYSPNSAGTSVKIAYGGNCQVADVADASTQATLASMAVALSDSSGNRYCTGTTLSYNPVTGIGYVLSAAHCVLGNPKVAGQQVTANNIVTFSLRRNYINQTLNAVSGSGTSGTIQAIYIPNQYCQTSDFALVGDSYQCNNLAAQNGDLALAKVNFGLSQSVNLNPQVRLATSDIQLFSPSYIMALGYGGTDANSLNR